MQTTPSLLAAAMGVRCEGAGRCFFCGAPADQTHLASAHVLASFTGRNDVRAPGSPVVCRGCILCLREDCEIPCPDGTAKRQTKAAMRGHSWVITPQRAVGATKANLAFLRETCIDPPEPPFSVVLTDGGQKHFLYRGVVCWSVSPSTVTLDGETITYHRDDLRERLDLCGRLVAATGKPALAETVTLRFALAVLGRYRDGEIHVQTWERVREEPLSRLATWLTPNKETCAREYPGDGGLFGVSPETGGAE